MILFKPPISKKVSAGFLCFAIILISLRQEEWKTLLNVNQVLVAVNQFPLWKSILTDPSVTIVPAPISLNENLITESTIASSWGLSLFESGNEAEAILVWQNAGLSAGAITANAGRYAQSINDLQTARIWFAHSVTLDPTLASSWYELGKINTQLGHYTAAKLAYEEALSLGYPPSVTPLATIWRDEGNYTNAIEIWQGALDSITSDPDRLLWWQGLTNSLRATEEWERAGKAVDLALEEFPTDAPLHVEKGAIIYGLYADAGIAMDAITTAINLDATLASAYSTAANIMARERQYLSAYGWYTEAIKQNDTVPSWYVARGHMARAAGNLPLALEAFLVAIERFPNSSSAYLGIAKVYQLLDQQENAYGAIEQALENDGLITTPDFLLAAEIYEWSNNVDGATTLYNQVLIMEPENVIAKQAIQRLQSK